MNLLLMSDSLYYQIVWFLANAFTGMAYLHIPYEMYLAQRGVKVRGLWYIGLLFFVYILACGLHHISMLRFVGHHPVDLIQLVVDSTMALASILTSYVMYTYRTTIRKILLYINENV